MALVLLLLTPPLLQETQILHLNLTKQHIPTQLTAALSRKMKLVNKRCTLSIHSVRFVHMGLSSKQLLQRCTNRGPPMCPLAEHFSQRPSPTKQLCFRLGIETQLNGTRVFHWPASNLAQTCVHLLQCDSKNTPFSSIMPSVARCGCPAQIPRLLDVCERGEGRRPPHAGQHFLCFACARPLWFICTLSFHPLQIPRPRDVPAQQLRCRFQSLPLARMSFRDRCTTTHRVNPRSLTVAIVQSALGSLQCTTRMQRSHLPTEVY